MDSCNSEQERAALITDTLNGLYTEAAENYKELNGDALENNLQGFYTRDVNWLNHLLQEKYGSVVPPQNQRIAEKNIFRAPMEQQAVELEDNSFKLVIRTLLKSVQKKARL